MANGQTVTPLRRLRSQGGIGSFLLLSGASMICYANGSFVGIFLVLAFLFWGMQLHCNI